MTASEAYSITTVLICVGLCQLSLADLIISIRHKAIMDFHIAGEGLVSSYMKMFRFAYDGVGAWILKILSLLCGLACIGLIIFGLNPRFMLVALFIFHLFSYPRWRHFVSSDSPFFRAVLITLILHYFLPLNQVITEAGLLFIAGYLVLIYQLTAIQKLKSRLWRNGQAIESFMNRFPFWRMISPSTNKPDWFLKAAARSVMLFELLFFTGLFWPELAFIFMIAGLMFHGVLSFSAGINHFFWTFIAGYPVYFYVSGKVIEMVSQLGSAYQGL